MWTESQQIKFIESLWRGLPVGTYTIHSMDWYDKDAKPKKWSGMILDGQQRLTSINNYWEDKFEVFGATWSELTKRDKRRFKGMKFESHEIAIWDEKRIKELYDLLAYGGTAHDESQYT